jgi:hypothetical protein
VKTNENEVFAIALLSFSAYAHRGTAACDKKRLTTPKATVTECNWAKPRLQIDSEANDDRGKMVRGVCET